jgi:hypothetical protein
MDYEQRTPNTASKIIFLLSFILVIMDLREIYYSYTTLLKTSQTYDTNVFETCIKYHLLGQMLFTGFATFAGISACLMSLGLIVSYDFFSIKCLDTFLYWNYIVFGPYLFAVCILGYTYFNEVLFVCDYDYLKTMHQSFNYSTLFALMLCFFISFLITFSFAIVSAYFRFNQSIRFRPGGIHLLGTLFWKYVRGQDRVVDTDNDQEQNNNYIN